MMLEFLTPKVWVDTEEALDIVEPSLVLRDENSREIRADFGIGCSGLGHRICEKAVVMKSVPPFSTWRFAAP